MRLVHNGVQGAMQKVLSVVNLKGGAVILTDRISHGADDYRFVALWLDERISGMAGSGSTQVRHMISSL
ncbi:MAG: hypothetical protein C4581_00460 [Nitrospiraceae bacterium]|nr:MAG: hypothetical protein C4581_00460 [Nitrospiraceae bacterium]